MENANGSISMQTEQDAEKQIVELSKKIEFYITEYSIELLHLKMGNGDFYVPDYQREFTWEDKRRSRFIESLLMGLPIPFLFFWEHPESGTLEIVDGSQRLRTITEFINGELVLSDLDSLGLLNGFRFENLTEGRRRKIKNRSIRGIVLSENTDEQSRFELFERINTGSKAANKAEVRRGALGGKFLDLVIKLSADSRFVKLSPLSKKNVDERMREELVTRFFAYSDGLDGYRDNVSEFIFKYSKKMNELFDADPEAAKRYEQNFLKMITIVDRTFEWGFRRTKSGRHTPKSRFEAIAIGSYLAIKQNPTLLEKDLDVSGWISGDEFKMAVGADGANAKARLEGRINFVKNMLSVSA